MTYTKQFLILVLTLNFSSLVTAQSSPSCRATFDDGAVEVVKQSFERDYLVSYRCLACRLNVTRFLSDLVADYPNLDPKEFEVLIITSSTFANELIKGPFIQFFSKFHSDSKHYRLSLTDRRLPPAKAILHEGEDPLPPWSFHVVLKFRGLIFDFDYTNKPTPISAEDYIHQMNILNTETGEYTPYHLASGNEILVLSLPGDQVVGTQGEIIGVKDLDDLFKEGHLTMLWDLQ